MLRTAVPRILPLLRQLPRRPVRERIVFVHIPKCGGTSVSEAIKATLGPRTYLHPRAIRNVHAAASLRASQILGEDLELTRERILVYHMSDPRCRMVGGHISVSRRALEEFGDGWGWVTVLRDPEARWFSQYFYNREKAVDHFRVDQPLEEFVGTARARAMGCDYARRLAGLHAPPTDPAAAVETALANLDRFAVAGVLERLDDFAAAFKARFGATLEIPHQNRNPLSGSRQRAEVTDAVREAVRELCAPDRRIYDAVAARRPGAGDPERYAGFGSRR